MHPFIGAATTDCETEMDKEKNLAPRSESADLWRAYCLYWCECRKSRKRRRKRRTLRTLAHISDTRFRDIRTL